MDFTIISTECIDSFEPKIVRVTIRGPAGILYSFDFPSFLFPVFMGPLGINTNPCEGKK